MFDKIYNEYLLHKNEENSKERYIGKESWYHASGAGFCSRKLYYESVEKLEPTNAPDEESMRRMRLGTIVHEDIQDSLIYYNNIYNNTNNKVSSDKANIAVLSGQKSFDTEIEIRLDNFNVRGFYDILMKEKMEYSDDIAYRLYDIKTSSSWGFRQKFGMKTVFPDENRNHFLQLATYGLAVKEKYGSLDSMHMLYYNKDNSKMQMQNVPLKYLDKAKRYWHAINEEHKKGVPNFNFGTSPAYQWCCGYCPYKDHCKPPDFKKKNK